MSVTGGRLTTHVLDTMHGCPAAGMRIELFRLDPVTGEALRVREVVTNGDGRVDGPVVQPGDLLAGRYELVFHAGDYFRLRGVTLPEPSFLETVPVRFGISDGDAHYHVPLLLSPWAYSTYRGS
ncbi:MAG TPA: hydroxyisourate hydrolase [Chloroflexi bacterium]|nr:hydroxyisourate hydrolase [Pseudomonadota bacterium]NDF39156.1 hydroxyisourate hydrolase [Pseudomonadota bacterium]HAN16149.1 hydroxyisourate hydrolase [Chloroflexota bacterium]